MNAMRYALSASEKDFKDAVRGFAGREIPAAGDVRFSGPGVIETIPLEVGQWLTAARPDGLSRVEEVVAVEEITRRCPASAQGFVAAGLFGSLSPGLCRAAADLGTAQGVLGPQLAEIRATGKPCGVVLQSLADAVTGIEAARLKLYRAAILEDAGRRDDEESAGAERLAGALARAAGELMKRITTGGNDEARNALQEGDRDGDR
jgi:alkylation response protein AidB-like acyl-CoA dehydrogenase